MSVLLAVLLIVSQPSALSRTGVISHNDDARSTSYLALPCKHGNVRCDLLVELCGPATCEILRQTDYGPSQRVHPDRIADVHPRMFERLCGVPAGAGLCRGSWREIGAEDEARPTLPPTDTLPPSRISPWRPEVRL